MADRRFHRHSGALALGEIARIAEIELPAGADAGRSFDDVAGLDDAGPSNVTFLDNRKYLKALAATKAGACFIHPSLAGRVPAGCLALGAKNAYRAYARVAAAFHPPAVPVSGVHPTAFVDPAAVLGAGASIGPNATVLAGARLGAGVRIGPNAVVGENVELGDACVVGAGASISHAVVGARTVVYPGARIGQDGFGFVPDPAGHVKVPQLGIVRIGTDCEIGANACIDRGSASDTVVGDGTWIDNLVQIGHNVKLGRGCVIVAQVGISGSTEFGAMVMAGGQAGISGHLHVGDGARIIAQSGVHRDIGPGEIVGGSPAVPAMEYRRQAAALRRLAQRKGPEEDESEP
ncbi:MAG: UDP-3-O-(3-hydroxymyristoyl)glucosamine N-acyltransferase [Rhodospirillales bacterium]|nr:UDP-3-O-(3-hydroxymyristoyl)glucosamine N-acyltransferase [Rhodospirillales bacterium]